MSKKKPARIAQSRPDGKWEHKKEGAERASSVHETQAEAWKEAKKAARKEGGQAKKKGRDGKFKDEHTYGDDPYPPPG